MDNLTPEQEMEVNESLAREFIESRLEIESSPENVALFAQLIFQIEHKADPLPMGRLVLTRRVEQKLIIGKNIIIGLLRAQNGEAQFYVQAPKDVVVNRYEVHERIQDEKQHDE